MKKGMFRKLACLVLALVMLLSGVDSGQVFSAYAVDDTETLDCTHSYEKGICASCGAVDPAATEGTALDDFEYTLDADSETLTLTKYIGTDTAVTVADVYVVDEKAYHPILDAATLFRGNTTITSVTVGSGADYLDNSMSYLFAECTKLTDIDLSEADTASVTDMSYLFYQCAALKSLELSGLDTQNVTTMRSMFSYCKKLADLTGYENWDTGSLECMYQMFNWVGYSASGALETVDLRNWDLDQVTNTGWCFQYCFAQQILLPDNLAVMSAGFLNHAQKVAGTSYTIPVGVKKIGYAHTIYDFATNDFVEFIVAEGNTNYKTVDGILYSADGTEMLAVPRNKPFEDGIFEIPEGVTFLGELSFSRNYNITTLVLPDTYVIEYVPLYDDRYIVFEDKGNLNTGTNLSIAIYCYTGITEYAVKDSNPNYSSANGIIYSKDGTQVVAIPARYAQQMDIPEGVTKWNKEAMWADTDNNSSSTLIKLLVNCPGVSIPASLKEISDDQLSMLNLLHSSRAGTSNPFTITIAEGNTAFELDSDGSLCRHTHSYENGVCTCGDVNIVWESGTIQAANGADSANSTRLRTADHLKLSDFGTVTVGLGYHLTWLAYDADLNYIGNGITTFTGNWKGSGVSVTTAEILEAYPEAVYFRLALRSSSSAALTLDDVAASGVTFYAPGEEIPEREQELEYENVLTVSGGQDGAIWDGKLFALGKNGTGKVYDLESGTALGSITLDGTDVLMPHANSVCFGSTYYDQDDAYPLLYVNVYNNYASATDRMEGTCCVYRVTEQDSAFTTELVQVIRIGFTEDLTLWKSKENNGDVRPYGNFVVDAENGKLYAFVMRDADKTTRFFRFAIPALTDGTYSEDYGCNVVTLDSEDIEKQFDVEYFNYLQGCTCSSGMIVSAEGFDSGSSAEPVLRLVDLETETVTATYYMANSGLLKEAELVSVDPETGTLYYAASDGVLRILTLPDTHFHGYTAAVTAPTCTEKGYTTHTCTACGDAYTDSYVDALGHSYSGITCTVCGEEHPNAAGLAGKTISILGDSLSTYTGISNDATANSTIGKNATYFTPGRYGVYEGDTWWMQAVNDLGLELLVNNSWSGSSMLYDRSGTAAAYVDRCVQLHNDTTGEDPDIIVIQMGINDFQYYKDTLGTADIDYGALITDNGDGTYTYAEPATSLEAAAIMLHKISLRYPNAEVYFMNISQRIDGTDTLLRSFNADLEQVVEHFGANIVDIYNSAITMEDFDTYIADGRVHPNQLGMDVYTEAFEQVLLENTEYTVLP